MARMPRTLGMALEEFRGMGPGFHFLRHFLSVAILVFHCYLAIRGQYDAALTPGTTVQGITEKVRHGNSLLDLARPGLFALVGTFFALSGFLIAGSAIRTRSIRVFFVNRALRILPALSVEVVLSAFVLGPLVTSFSLAAYFGDELFLRYFWNIVGHVQFYLPGVFLDNPWPRTVNLNLWTLPSELYCYLFMMIVLAIGLMTRHLRLTALVLTLICLALLATWYDPVSYTVKANNTHFTGWYIVLLFMVGVLFFINAHRIPLNTPLLLVSAVCYYISIRYDVLLVLSGIPLCYCMVHVGMLRFGWFDRLLKMDLSYGIYLYGFPLTQALIFATRHLLAGEPMTVRLITLVPAVVVLTALFSTVSWLYIEKPLLGLRRFMLPPKAA